MNASHTETNPNQALLELADAIRAEWRAGAVDLAKAAERLRRQLERQEQTKRAIAMGLGGLYAACGVAGLLVALGTL